MVSVFDTSYFCPLSANGVFVLTLEISYSTQIINAFEFSRGKEEGKKGEKNRMRGEKRRDEKRREKRFWLYRTSFRDLAVLIFISKNRTIQPQ